MKKTIALIFMLAVLVLGCIPINAAEIACYDIDDEICNILMQNIDGDTIDALYDPDTFRRIWITGANVNEGERGEFLNIDLPPYESVTVAKIYPIAENSTTVWKDHYELSFSDLIAKADSNKENIRYELLCDYSEEFIEMGVPSLAERQSAFRFTLKYLPGGDIRVASITSSSEFFRKEVLSDIKNMRKETVIDGVSCRINNVYFFEEWLQAETVVYLDTDKGIFVKHYWGDEPATVHTYEEFKDIVKGYCDYYSDINNHHVVIDNKLPGGFNGYKSSIYGREEQYTAKSTVDTDDTGAVTDNVKWVNDNTFAFASGILVGALVGGMIVLIVVTVINKIKKRS